MSDMKAYDRFRMKVSDQVLVRVVYFIDAPHRAHARYPTDLVRMTLYYRPDGYSRSMRFMLDMSNTEALVVARDLITVAHRTKEYSTQKMEFYGS